MFNAEEMRPVWARKTLALGGQNATVLHKEVPSAGDEVES